MVITEFWVMPSRAPAVSGGVMIWPLAGHEEVLAGALAHEPCGLSRMASS